MSKDVRAPIPMVSAADLKAQAEHLERTKANLQAQLVEAEGALKMVRHLQGIIDRRCDEAVKAHEASGAEADGK